MEIVVKLHIKVMKLYLFFSLLVLIIISSTPEVETQLQVNRLERSLDNIVKSTMNLKREIEKRSPKLCWDLANGGNTCDRYKQFQEYPN